MEYNSRILVSSPLFRGLEAGEIETLLKELQSRRRNYARGSFVFYAGDEIRALGIVLSGVVHIVQEDYWGNRNILAAVTAGGMFGEAFASLPEARAGVDVVVVEKSEILFVDVNRILQSGVELTKSRGRLAANLLAVLSRKNVALTRKIRYMGQRTTRQKLMSYLSDEAQRAGKNTFTLSFNRQELADFLSVDRSAMSAELSRMKRDGLILYNKSTFTLCHE